MIYVFEDNENGKTVARLEMYTIRLSSRFLGVIENVYTEPAYRKQGRATELIKQAIEKAHELGLDCVELTVREDQSHIQEFYEKLGFYHRHNIAMRLPIKSFRYKND